MANHGSDPHGICPVTFGDSECMDSIQILSASEASKSVRLILDPDQRFSFVTSFEKAAQRMREREIF